jgi:hypothetical protein
VFSGEGGAQQSIVDLCGLHDYSRHAIRIREVARTMAKASYFISYNQSDRAWAEWIAWTIESFGFRTRIQAWDFVPGTAWPQEMHRALQECAKTLCVLSPDFLRSEFTAAEWQATFTRDPVGKHGRLVLVRVRECMPDGLLAARVYVDLVGKNREDARALVRQTVEAKRAKPAAEPSFPGQQPGEPTFPGPRYFALVLDGTFAEVDRLRVEAMVAHLRKFLNDPKLTIRAVRPGSVIFCVECSEPAFRMAATTFTDPGAEQFVEGHAVKGFWPMSKADADPVEERLTILRERLPDAFARFVPKADAEDLAQEFVLAILESDDLRYAALTSLGTAAQLGRSLLTAHQRDRERDRALRERVAQQEGGAPRMRILEVALGEYQRLSNDEREAVERFWTATFEGSEVERVLRQRVEEINEAMADRVQLAL